MLVSGVQAFYQDCFQKLGGNANVMVKDGIVSVTWYPQDGNPVQQVASHSLRLLQQGQYRKAEPLLRALLARDPDHTDALFNLGLMLSDQGKLDEAVSLLQKFVGLEPEHSQGWTALGVALARNGEKGESLGAVRRALEIDPENAHAVRNLGALLIQENPEEALPYFERAVQLLPEDQAARYGHAQCLLDLGRTQEADRLFLKTIEMDPLSDVAEKARAARTSMAQSSLRSVTGQSARPDATMYCLQGLRKFRDLGAQETRAIVFEIAMLGRSGLDINSPEKRYSLRSLPGDFSGLQLVSLMYVGMKLFDPKADVGIDLSKEYDAALLLLEKGVDGE